MKTKVTKEQIDALMQSAIIKTQNAFNKVTIVSAQFPSGFVITESSACVDPANYDQNIGSVICMKRIEDKLWELEGYRLQCMIAGFEELNNALIEKTNRGGEILQAPIKLDHPEIGQLNAFSDAHSISDILRYAISQADIDEIQTLLDIEAIKTGQDPSIGGTLQLIRSWGGDKQIIGPNGKATAKTQFTKLLEEVEELRIGIEKEAFDEIDDAIGDCVVVLTLLAELIPQPKDNGTGEDPIPFSVEQAIRSAYEVISKRTGKMVDGVFVKDA